MAVITISRGSFSGGSALAEALAERLGYRLLSREDLLTAAERFGVSEPQLAEALEHEPRFLDRFNHERTRYVAVIQAALCEEVCGDDIIYHGLAGHLLLPGVGHVLRVRLIAPLPQRIEAAMARRGLARAEAESYVEAVDRARARWTKHVYGVEWHDAALYDLVINLQHADLAAATAVAAAAATSAAFTATDASRWAMTDLLLASRVRAALALDAETAVAMADVRVSADAATGTVTLHGQLSDALLGRAVIARTEAVEGVRQVEAPRLFYWSSSA